MRNLRESILSEKSFGDMVAQWFDFQFHTKEYFMAVKAMREYMNSLPDTTKHSIEYYAQKIASRYRNVEGDMLSKLYKDTVSESEVKHESVEKFLKESKKNG